MMLTLSAKNKLGFVNGTIDVPEITSNDYKLWERCNDLVISWILFNLDENIARSVLFLKTARSIWKDLEERFGSASITQLYPLQQNLNDVSQGQLSVSEFFTKIKTLWDAIDDADPTLYCTCDKCVCDLTQKVKQKKQEERVLQFLMKLNEQYSTVRGHILMMQPLPNISQAYRLIVQEENHKDMSQNSQAENMAFLADKRRFHDSASRQSYDKNNNRKDLSGNWNKKPLSQKSGSNYYCTHCKIPGHSVDRYYKIHGFPPGFKFNKDRKVAAFSCIPNENKVEENGEINNTTKSETITVDQYNHLVQLMTQHKLSALIPC